MGNYLSYEVLEQRITRSRLEALCHLKENDLVLFSELVIERAESLIDGYASLRYRTPLGRDPLLEEWALCIAEYELYKRGPGSDIPEKIRRSYQDTLQCLQDLAAGKLSFNGKFQTAEHPGKSLFVSERENVFDPDSMKEY